MNRRFMICTAACSLFFNHSSLYGQFATVVNIPPSTAPTSVESNTQINVLATGSVGDDFHVGSSDGSTSNIEFNLLPGGRTGWRLRVHQGGVANISGGNTDNGIFVDGGELNIINGVVKGRVSVSDGGKLDMTGGIIEYTSFGSLEVGSGEVNLGGGIVGEGMAVSGSGVVNVTGGRFGPRSSLTGGTVNFFGGEFKLNGAPIEGLASIGDSIPFEIPPGSLLTGTLVDGSTFSIGHLPMYHRDTIGGGVIQLHRASIPPLTSGSIPAVPTPGGVRGGQALNLSARGVLGDSFNVAPGGILNVNGGSVGYLLEAVAGNVNQTSGRIGSLAAMLGSTVAIAGGTVGEIELVQNSTATITGGRIAEMSALESTVNVLSGQVDSLRLRPNSVANVSGNASVQFLVSSDSVIRIAGGVVGGTVDSGGRAEIIGGVFREGENGLTALAGSEVSIVAKSFALDGVPIRGLVPGQQMVLTGTAGILSGVFADNTPFEFRLVYPPCERCGSGAGAIARDAALAISLAAVPEPSTAFMMFAAVSCISMRRACRRKVLMRRI